MGAARVKRRFSIAVDTPLNEEEVMKLALSNDVTGACTGDLASPTCNGKLLNQNNGGPGRLRKLRKIMTMMEEGGEEEEAVALCLRV